MNLSQADLWGELQLFLLVPSLIYIAMLTVKERMKDYKSLYLLTFVILWLLWWLLFNAEPGALLSIHLYSARFLAQLFVAKFLYDVWHYASQRQAPSSHTIILTHADRELMLYPLKLVVIIVIITTVVPHLIREASDLYFKNVKFTNAFNEMVRYIGNNTEKDAVFSGWDWSLPWHLDLDNGGDRIIKDRATYPPEHREGVSEYFIVSPEWPLVPETDEWPNVSPSSEWGLRENAMRKGFLEKHASLVRSFPAGKHKWMLFKINDTSVARPASESQSPSPRSNSVQDRLSSQIN